MHDVLYDMNAIISRSQQVSVKNMHLHFEDIFVIIVIKIIFEYNVPLSPVEESLLRNYRKLYLWIDL